METIATIRIVLENEAEAGPPPQTKEITETPPRPPPMPDLALPPPQLGLPVGPLAKEDDDDLAEWEADLYRRKQIGRTASHRAAGYGPYAAGQGPVPTQPGNNIVMTPFVEGTHAWVDSPVISWYQDDEGYRQSREWHDGYGLAALGDREVRVTADYVALGSDNRELGEWANSAESGFYIHTGPGPADG